MCWRLVRRCGRRLEEGEAAPAGACAAAGGELVCGWAGTNEIVTLDPAQINQVLQFQIRMC